MPMGLLVLTEFRAHITTTTTTTTAATTTTTTARFEISWEGRNISLFLHVGNLYSSSSTVRSVVDLTDGIYRKVFQGLV